MMKESVLRYLFSFVPFILSACVYCLMRCLEFAKCHTEGTVLCAFVYRTDREPTSTSMNPLWWSEWHSGVISISKEEVAEEIAKKHIWNVELAQGVFHASPSSCSAHACCCQSVQSAKDRPWVGTQTGSELPFSYCVYTIRNTYSEFSAPLSSIHRYASHKILLSSCVYITYISFDSHFHISSSPVISFALFSSGSRAEVS